MTEQWYMPSGDELKSSGGEGGEFTALASDDYIVKMAKIDLLKVPVWNQALRKFETSKFELKYKLICLPYKLKADDGMVDINGKEQKALSSWVWREINPFALGATQTGAPTFLRSIVALCQGLEPAVNARLPMPGIVVLTSDDEIANEEDTVKYKAQFKAVLDGVIPAEDEMKSKGFKHVPDIRGFEGQYIGAKITLDKRNRNKIEGFSKLPKSFAADKALEAEAMKKFLESYQKMQNKRNTNGGSTTGEVTTDEVVSTADIPF